MAFRWQWLLILPGLWLAGERSFASGAREDRAYAAAVSAFQDGMWNRAETEFAKFIEKYPDSSRVPEAVLTQAEAEFEQGKLQETIALLAAHKAGAGGMTDEYVYWIGQAQCRGGNYPVAAETFLSLARDFPESSFRLRAVVEASWALAQANEWPRVVSLLEPADGVFQRVAQTDPANELVVRGSLLLAQAEFMQRNFTGAAAVLAPLNLQTLKPQLDWPRAYWLYQVKLALGDTGAALAATTNLVQIGLSENNEAWQAEGLALRADVLEQLGQTTNALAACGEILAIKALPERQRQTVLKMAALAIVQNQYADAGQSLRKYLAQIPAPAAMDMARLTLGELQLNDYLARLAATNHLPAVTNQLSVAVKQLLAATNQLLETTNQLTEAQSQFDQFLSEFANSPLAGKAYLDRGWCLWIAGKTNAPETLEAFQNAVQSLQRLPPSEELAEARFKTGDVLFAQTNYAGALTNYRAVLDGFTHFPAVTRLLGGQALYQSLRASLALTNLTGASDALEQILRQYPTNDLAASSALLYGQSLAEVATNHLQAAAAREVFEKFERQFPGSPLRSQAAFAVARTYELETNWPAAIAGYQDWLGNFPADDLQPQVNYTLARANYQAGNETNAFGLFTNFVVRFQTNGLAPLAQYWVADHYFRLGGTNYMEAEKNYKMLYQNTNWQDSPLIYQARLMAGRAAMGLPSYNDAIDHFTSLTSDTNCPSGLNAQALFAYGSVLMLKDSTDTNNPLANFELATNVFGQLDSTNELGVLARVEIGDCNVQLANYDAATNAYAQAVNSAYANVSTRSRAQIGLGLALEKKAVLTDGTNQTALLQLALDNYLAVFDTRFGENDPFWVKKAGLQALSLMTSPALSGTADPNRFINGLEALFPQAREALEKKRAALQPAKN